MKGGFLMKKAIMIVFMVCLCILSACSKPEPSPLFDRPHNPEVEDTLYVYVDIKGAVKNPGIYKLAEGKRIIHLLKKAGGVNVAADVNGLNLSEPLKDGTLYRIPKVGEALEEKDPAPNEATFISINEATMSELETLPKIGPATARSIIDYRNEFGPFEFIEDIMNVKGIGEATFEAFKDSIEL
jgi:competence protein ComEA